MRKWFNRLFVFATIPIVLLAFCVPRVDAVGLSFGDNDSMYHTYWSGFANVYFEQGFSDSSAYFAQVEIPASYAFEPAEDELDYSEYSQDVFYSSVGPSVANFSS